MSAPTVTFYTDANSLVGDLNKLQSGQGAYLFVNPSPGYIQIVLPISEYVFDSSGTPAVIRVEKKPVS